MEEENNKKLKEKENKLKQKDKNYENELKEKNQKILNLLKILEYKLKPINDEISIIYKINQKQNNLKIFGSNFVDNNKNICKIIYNDKVYELKEYLDIDKIDLSKEFLEIKLNGINQITNLDNMFCNCKELFYVSDFSKIEISNIISKKDMFYNCPSLIHFPDISNWQSKYELIDELIRKFDNEYYILSIRDEDEVRNKIIELNLDEDKIRYWIEDSLL